MVSVNKRARCHRHCGQQGGTRRDRSWHIVAILGREGPRGVTTQEVEGILLLLTWFVEASNSHVLPPCHTRKEHKQHKRDGEAEDASPDGPKARKGIAISCLRFAQLYGFSDTIRIR